MTELPQLPFDNRYAQLGPAFGTRQSAVPLTAPRWAAFNPSVAELIGLPPDAAARPEWLNWMSGAGMPPGACPLAMKYAGHQFGVYNPELGDGRGLLLGEVDNPRSGRWDLHLKGAGQTPYSRFGDGRAVLRSSIREYLGSEAVAALGIPSTRALCIVDSDTTVYRERPERGATLLRVARTHLRFGHFEWFHYSGQSGRVQQLADFAIELYYPDWQGMADRYELLLRETVQRTARMIAAWQAYGFAHGVLNTDNMSLLGETFDYGPFAFLDDFEPGYISNHSDHAGRYAFDRQPGIGLWNLNALAHAFSTLLDSDRLKDALTLYEPTLMAEFERLIRARLGLVKAEPDDMELANQLFIAMRDARTDMTRWFRGLSDLDRGQELVPLAEGNSGLEQWCRGYQQRLQRDPQSIEQRCRAMRAVNPKYILRNYLAQRAIEQAEAGDYREIERLLQILRAPFEDQPEHDEYASAPAPENKHLPISCSS